MKELKNMMVEVYYMKTSSKVIIIILILAIIIAPLYLLPDADFEGADDEGMDTLAENNPEYEAWAEPFIEPASGEIESLLFASQAALGASVIGYYFGVSKGKRNVEDR